MQRRDGSSQPLGICQRLFNFIVYGLIVRRFKRVTLGRAVPIEGSSSNSATELPPKASIPDQLDRKDDLSSEIEVKFRHKMKEYHPMVAQTAVAEPPKEKELRVRETSLMGGRGKTGIDHPKIEGEISALSEASTTTGGRGEVPKNSVSIDYSEGETEEERKRERDQNLPNEILTLDIESGDTEMKRPALERPHLLTVDPNINADSDAYIKRKLEEMSRNYSLDPRQS